MIMEMLSQAATVAMLSFVVMVIVVAIIGLIILTPLSRALANR